MQLSAYLTIFYVLLLSLGGTTVAIVLSRFLSAQRPDNAKLSSYECGFPSFETARSRVEVRFYLVAILFIIFDVELAFLLPWAVSLSKIGWFGFGSMMGFLLIFILGFVYEWRKGGLEWK